MEDLQFKLDRYNRKNQFFESKKTQWLELDTVTFLHLIFNRDTDEDPRLLPFEDTWCEAYDWWIRNKRNAVRPPEYKYVYNGICQAIYGKDNPEKNKTYILTSNYNKLREILDNPFVIMSPISYTGKRRIKSNARYLYAIVIDIDESDEKNIENLLYQTDNTRPTKLTFPQPNIIVNSGNGIHIYYLLEIPVPMFNDTYEVLNRIKKELTWRAWNKGTTLLNPNKPQFQGNCQGFRLPGTQTKFYTKVRAFRNLNPNIPTYYKIQDLAQYGKILSPEESALLEKGQYKPQRTTLQQAKELFPDWYERRIVQKMRKNRWVIKRDLYDWFKRQIYDYARVGHRYFCCMGMVIYAKKCNISEEELDKDLAEMALFLDGLSYTPSEEDRFTLEDAMDAKSTFQECYCTFPRDEISLITGVPMKEGRRNYRGRKEHLRRARIICDGLYPDGSWRNGNGRKDKSAVIAEWREKNPEGTKAQCCRELNLTKPTVYKWWNISK